jgi:hypothetical protein
MMRVVVAAAMVLACLAGALAASTSQATRPTPRVLADAGVNNAEPLN